MTMLANKKIDFEFRDADSSQKMVYLASLGVMAVLSLKMLHNEVKGE